MYDNILNYANLNQFIIQMHQRNHDCKAVIYTAANIFQRLDILARDVIEHEKQYVCTYKAYPKSRTSIIMMIII